MALMDKLKGMVKADVDGALEKHAPEIAEKIASALEPQLAKVGPAIRDDDKYRTLVATPSFLMLPPMVQLLGRERLKWDPIMLAVRDEVVVVDGSRLSLRPNAHQIVLAIVKRHFGQAAS